MTFEFPTTPEASLIVGGPQTGKTRRLVEHAARLVRDGASPRDIAVFVASPSAISPMKSRLSETLPALADTPVLTVRHLAMDVLSTPQACEITGRRARVLDEYEKSFLMEDMKGTGIRPGRLKGMLGFFFRCYTELEDLDPAWLELREEEEAHERLSFLLSSLKAYLEPELSNAAYRTLASDAQLLDRYRIPHVIVDDYQTLSRASQVIVNLVADESVCIAGDAYECVQSFESYPYAAGMDEFAAAMPYADRIELAETHMDENRLASIRTLFARGSLSLEDDGATGCVPEEGDDRGSSFEIKECLDPEGETAWTLAWVQHLLDSGTSANDIVIVAPNSPWERRIGKALTQANVPICFESALRPVGGDIRYGDSCQAARVLCLLALAADPHDEPSLRAWCGFGEYLTNSQLFYELEQDCAHDGTPLWKALSNMASDPRFEKPYGETEDVARSEDAPFQFMSEAEPVAAAYRTLQEMLSELEGLRGKQLVLRAVELVYDDERPRLPLNLAHALTVAEEGDDAAVVYAKMTSRRLFPRLPEDKGVRIVRAATTCGIRAEAVLVMGAVNGFMPPHRSFDEVAVAPDRAAVMRSRATRGLIAALGLASHYTAVTYFTELPYRDAEKYDLKVERIYIRDGLRRARVAKTVLLDD